MDSHGITVEGSTFWVVHRRRTYGPFDYAWSPDFCGVELLYRGEKFGEYCSRDELCADLRGYRLPMSVVAVTSIVMGCIVHGVLQGLAESERLELVRARLCEFGYARFAPAVLPPEAG